MTSESNLAECKYRILYGQSSTVFYFENENAKFPNVILPNRELVDGTQSFL